MIYWNWRSKTWVLHHILIEFNIKTKTWTKKKIETPFMALFLFSFLFFYYPERLDSNPTYFFEIPINTIWTIKLIGEVISTTWKFIVGEKPQEICWKWTTDTPSCLLCYSVHIYGNCKQQIYAIENLYLLIGGWKWSFQSFHKNL